MKVVVGTRNPGKVREVREILAAYGVTVQPLPSGLPDAPEEGETFEENAVSKAMFYANLLDGLVIADDSGLEVYALGGLPGVLSARFAGTHGDDAANIRKLLEMLRGSHDRRARFRCVVAAAERGKTIAVCEGVCEGRITEREQGRNGFGYDPVFVPEGETRTFAEMTQEEKNALSHRGAALRKMARKLETLLAGR